MIKNNGHSNIDNNGNFFISGRDGYNFSARFKYSSKYLYFEIEPYVFNQNNLFNEENSISQSYQHLNNHHILKNSGSISVLKFRQLFILMESDLVTAILITGGAKAFIQQ